MKAGTPDAHYMKNLNQIDLNLLVYLEVLLRERNVTQAANQLGLSQPAMSNGLRRLRALFDDPLLVRTSEGMTPTERALELEPLVKEILLGVDRAMQPATEFEPGEAQMVVRIMASDYAESTLFPAVLTQLRENAPGHHPRHNEPLRCELSGCRARQGRLWLSTALTRCPSLFIRSHCGRTASPA